MLQVHSRVSCRPSLHCTPTCAVWRWAIKVNTVWTLAVVAIAVVNTCSAILTRTAGTQVHVCAARVPRVACCARTGEAVQGIDAGASVLTRLAHTVVHQVSTRLPSVPHGTGAVELPTYTGSTIFTSTTAVIRCTEGGDKSCLHWATSPPPCTRALRDLSYMSPGDHFIRHVQCQVCVLHQ